MPARAKPPAPWKNRVVGTGDEAPENLLAHPYQWRIHPDAQQQALLAAISDVGYVQPILVSKQTGHVLDGHCRVMLAMRTHQATIPVTYVDVTEDEERLILATIDPIAGLAAADKEMFGALLHEAHTGEPALQALLSGLAEEYGLIQDPDGAGGAEGDGEAADGSLLKLLDVTLAEPRHAVEAGQVWRLGERHTLVCLDVHTDWPRWHRFLQDADPDLVFAPYPGPFLALSNLAATQPLLLVQPEAYIAGHILDRYTDVHGAEAVRCVGAVHG